MVPTMKKEILARENAHILSTSLEEHHWGNTPSKGPIKRNIVGMMVIHKGGGNSLSDILIDPC